jgi:oligopeptide/dipeptide ABC transporter ATP-binding protein
MSRLLSVENLQVQFKMRTGNAIAVDNFSLTVESGQCVGIVGESGCGKSTTGFAIMQLLAGNGFITDGRIVFDGTDLATLSEKDMQDVRGNKIALIPQDPLTSLNPTTKIGRQVGEGYKIHRGASDEEATKRVLEVLEMVEMPRPKERLNQYPFELSGGLRQRVMIAMGLVCAPSLLIADEPTTALDVTIQEQILDIFDSLRKELAMSVILITHDMGVIAGRTDNVVVMYAGRKAEENTTEKLFATMRHPYTQALLASVPSIDASKGATLRSIAGLPPDLSKEIMACRFAPRCQYATAKCHNEDPPATVDKDGSEYACFYPVNGPAGLDEVKVEIRERTVSTKEILRITSLTKEFPIRSGPLRRKTGKVHAVSGVSFAVYEGETFGLVGESGCGKTTTGRMIVGLEHPNSGEIIFEDRDVTSMKGRATRALQRDRQMMFQDPYSSLNPRMKVGDIIREPLAIQKVGTHQEQVQQVARLMTAVGLDPASAQRHPHEFSGGQRQRIGLARALALNPKLVVADEPVSALDVSIQAQILNLMKELQQDLGVSFVMVSHDLAVVNYMADRIGVMYLGEIVEVGDSESVFRRPAHPYTQGLLNAVPLPDPKEAKNRKGIKIEGELPSSANPPSGCRFRTRCPRAQEVCAEVAPPMQSFGPVHEAACYFPLVTPVSVGATKAMRKSTKKSTGEV